MNKKHHKEVIFTLKKNITVIIRKKMFLLRILSVIKTFFRTYKLMKRKTYFLIVIYFFY